MGQNFCKGCDHGCPLSCCEGDLSNKNNKPFEPFDEQIYYINNDYEQEKNQNNDKCPSFNSFSNNNVSINNNYIFTNNKKNLNYQNEIYPKNIYSNSENHLFNNNNIDKKELSKIIYNYRIKLLFKYFFKFFSLKKKSLNEIFIEDIYISLTSSNDNLKNNNYQPDIDLMPINNYLYIGNKFNNKKEGYGLEIFHDIDAKYFGTYKNNIKSGYCKFQINFEEKNYYYIGEISNNLINGYGFYENLLNNIKYEGYWKNSMREGIGIESYDDGSLYCGEFLMGKKNGVGYYQWSDNSFYEGEWSNNMLNGYGIYNFSEGSKYIGSWSNNKMNGIGEFKYLSNKNYFGFFKDDIRCGFGILCWFQVKKAYIGFWENNKQNGLGKFINNDKIVFGKWKNGKLIERLDEEDFFECLTNVQKIYISHFMMNSYDEFKNKMIKILSNE